MTDREAFETAFTLLNEYFNALTDRSARAVAEKVRAEMPALKRHFEQKSH